MELTVSSKTGSEQDSCLNVEFSDGSNSLTCVADVVSNLVNPPSVLLMSGESNLDRNTDGSPLIYDISSDSGQFTCRVCIDVPEAEIKDHCSDKTISISNEGEYRTQQNI